MLRLLTTPLVPAPYLGQVATGSQFPDTLNAGAATQFNSATACYARDDITSLQVAFANYYGRTETASGGSMTVEASVEYPISTMTRITFSGQNSQTIASGANGDLSDAVAVTIPRGALFYIRSFVQNTSGVPFKTLASISTGSLHKAEFATSGLTSKVMSGTIAASQYGVQPVCIVGMTRRPAVALVGDSIATGTYDTFDDSTGSAGLLMRPVDPFFATITSGMGGAYLTEFISSSPLRRAIMNAYCSHVINSKGFNDIFRGDTGATVLTSIELMPALFPGKKLFQTTITPNTSSTDAWATVGNQTALLNTQRILLNKAIEAVPKGFEAIIDLASAVESSFRSGIFRVDLGTPTADGIHPTNVVYRNLRRSGVFNPAQITRLT